MIFEDYGPAHHTVLTPAAIPLFAAWPVAIGAVTFVYCGQYPALPSAFSTFSSRSDSDEHLSHLQT
jgi:hypothetical protein